MQVSCNKNEAVRWCVGVLTLAVLFVSSGTARLIHERLAHAGLHGAVQDSGGGRSSRDSHEGGTRHAHSCAVCDLLASLAMTAAWPPSVMVMWVISTIALAPALFLVAAPPATFHARGPPA